VLPVGGEKIAYRASSTEGPQNLMGGGRCTVALAHTDWECALQREEVWGRHEDERKSWNPMAVTIVLTS